MYYTQTMPIIKMCQISDTKKLQTKQSLQLMLHSGM